MYHFVTWIIEYSDDDKSARLLFLLTLPLLLVAKLVLSTGEGVKALFQRRERAEPLAVAAGSRNRAT
jgi:hypothetical protein